MSCGLGIGLPTPVTTPSNRRAPIGGAACPMGSCQQRPSSTRTSASRKITGPDRREGSNRIKQEAVRYATGADQQKAPGGGRSLALPAAQAGAPPGPARPRRRSSQGPAAEVASMSTPDPTSASAGANVLGWPDMPPPPTRCPRRQRMSCGPPTGQESFFYPPGSVEEHLVTEHGI